MEEEIKVKIREEETRLINLIQAIEALEKSEEWSKLKELLVDGLVSKTKEKILQEALSQDPKIERIEYLKGELAWSKKYADLGKYAGTLKTELESIRKRLR